MNKYSTPVIKKTTKKEKPSRKYGIANLLTSSVINFYTHVPTVTKEIFAWEDVRSCRKLYSVTAPKEIIRRNHNENPD